MKVLCMCNHGNVRSAALKYLIWRLNGMTVDTRQETIDKKTKYEAIAVGAHSSTLETKKYFINWADKVVDLSDEDNNMQPLLKELAGDKYIRFYIGLDIWGNSMNQELHSKLFKLTEDLVNSGFPNISFSLSLFSFV